MLKTLEWLNALIYAINHSVHIQLNERARGEKGRNDFAVTRDLTYCAAIGTRTQNHRHTHTHTYLLYGIYVQVKRKCDNQ